MDDNDKLPTIWAHPDGRLFMIALYGLVGLCSAFVLPQAWLFATIGIGMVIFGVTGMLLREYRRRKRGQ